MLDRLPQWSSMPAAPMAAEAQPLNAPSGSLKEMFSGSFMGDSRRVLEAKKRGSTQIERHREPELTLGRKHINQLALEGTAMGISIEIRALAGPRCSDGLHAKTDHHFCPRIRGIGSAGPGIAAVRCACRATHLLSLAELPKRRAG